MSLGEKWCKIVNGNKILCTRGGSKKNVKLFISPFSASFRSHFTAKYESAYINMAAEEEEKTVTA